MKKNMKKTVFISWSGEDTKLIGRILHEMLLKRFDKKGLLFFYSPEIPAGSIWVDSILTNLEKCCFGIICMSIHNVDSPWLNFEAGAISKTYYDRNKKKIPANSIYMFNIEKISQKKLKGPLSIFQVNNIEINQRVQELYEKINNLLNEEDKYTLEAINKMACEDSISFSKELNVKSNSELDIFISFPIKGTTDLDKKVEVLRRIVVNLQNRGFNILCSAIDSKIRDDDRVALDRINSIKKCKAYVIIHPEKTTMSFTLVECGIALALKKPTILLGKNNEDSFPKVLVDMASIGTQLEGIQELHSYVDEEDLLIKIDSFITKHITR